MDLGVEGAQRQRVGIVRGRVDDAAEPEHVVDEDKSARAQQLKAALVIGVVAGLVGVDEDEVVGSRAPFLQEAVECRDAGPIWAVMRRSISASRQ